MKKLRVIKIGGNVIDNEQNLDVFLKAFSAIKEPKILVHGGGKRASTVSKEMGIAPKMIDGRRITDADTLEVVTMVYGGLINKNIIAKLQSMDCDAMGFTGADLNIIPAKKRQHPSIDFGYVGDFEIKDINSKRLLWLIDGEVIPVFCALTHDSKGSLLNTNADTLASGIASAMAQDFEVSLEYCFEKPGVLLDPADDTSYIETLDHEKMMELKSEGVISEGMIPKLKNGFDALNNGVKEVIIKSSEALNINKGTILN
ncbi:MAG: acetylglutamate kinase [Bacteroidota bacterium]